VIFLTRIAGFVVIQTIQQSTEGIGFLKNKEAKHECKLSLKGA